MPVTHQDPSTGSIATAISNAVVRLLSEYAGRGPTKARTNIDQDLITVVLQDTLTKGERSLLRDGELALVLANRKALQNTMGAVMIAAVEQISGRSTIAFLSDNHIDPDIAIESFVLAPQLAHAGAEATRIGSPAGPTRHRRGQTVRVRRGSIRARQSCARYRWRRIHGEGVLPRAAPRRGRRRSRS